MRWFGWASAYYQHVEREIAELRLELKYEKDRNHRLAEHLMTLKVGAPIVATAPAMPREERSTTNADRLLNDPEFFAAGVDDSERADMERAARLASLG